MFFRGVNGGGFRGERKYTKKYFRMKALITIAK